MNLFRMFWFKHFLGQRYRWYRRWYGGRWERHWIDICGAFIWLDMHPARKWPEYRQPCSFGRPTIEDHPSKDAPCKTMCSNPQCQVGCKRAMKGETP